MFSSRYKNSSRFWEIDLLRGFAVVIMIIGHLLYDLAIFGGHPIDIYSLWWKIGASFTAGLFLLLVGVSLTLSASNIQNPSTRFFKLIKRGMGIFLLGILLTTLTSLFLYETIRFGILHLIGIAIIASFPFLKLPAKISFSAGLISILLGIIFSRIQTNIKYLFWLGLPDASFQSLDYYPLFPWFGVVLIGIAVGKIFYPDKKRAFLLPDWSSFPAIRAFCFLGRHSLIIYFVHQPVLLALLFIFGIISFQL